MSRLLRHAFLPPGLFLVLGAAGLYLLGRRPRWGRRLLITDLVLLYLLSLSPVSYGLQHSLEQFPALTTEQVAQSGAEAIVVLSGGARPDAPDYHAASPYWPSLVRTRYGGWLQRQTGLPIVVSGGGEHGAEAEAMATVLGETGIPRSQIWLEGKSLNTYQNAVESSHLLKAAGLKRILLVTEAYHMLRAVWCFEAQGLEVVAAPCEPAYLSLYDRGIFVLIPQSHSLFYSTRSLEEWLGNLFYRLRY